MKAKVLFGLAAVVLVLSLAAADDPWKDAAYAKWNNDDVQKILKSSPWGHEQVTAVKEAPRDEKAKATKVGAGIYTQMENIPTESVLVVWWSAKTTRRAVLRQAMLGGVKFKEEDARQFTETAMPDHEIVVWGDAKTLAVLARLEPAELKKAAYLDSPRLNRKIEAIAAVPEIQGNTPPDKISFHFPRKLDGQDTVTSEDKRLIFKWRLLRKPKDKLEDAKMFEVVFSPNKMVSGGAADY
jgi:hypothetical protein